MIIKASEPTLKYNCFGFAYDEDEDKWIDPNPDGEEYSWKNITPYWPQNIPKGYGLNFFISLYEGVGFKECDFGTLEEGSIKIALLIDKKGEPFHAIKQKSNGLWASKLGDLEDVTHLMPDIISYYDSLYKTENIVYMKRETK